MSSVIDRFVRYVKINTISSHESTSDPTTQVQFDLARLLVEECKALGMVNVILNDHCHVLAELPANTRKDVPVIGFNAHIDTSPDFSGENVKPQFVQYQGGDLVLNEAKGIRMSPKDFPDLNDYVGQELITADGTTLLGADDKAGIAEIMAAVEYLTQHPEIEHGAIKVCFTPDEEVGRGVALFDYETFGADFAYTVDGGQLGGLTYENFNAASADIRVRGRSVHPGSSKNKMINASLVAIELQNMLPVQMTPSYTEHYEGFFHLHQFNGTVEEAKAHYLIRDHDREKFEAKKELIQSAGQYLNKKYGAGTVEVTVTDAYYNMREKIEPVMHIIETAKDAMRAVGIEPRIEPIRGGTDGARMSYQGLPTPNLFTGGHNAHGPFEYIPTASMEKAVEVILKIIELYTERA